MRRQGWWPLQRRWRSSARAERSTPLPPLTTVLSRTPIPARPAENAGMLPGRSQPHKARTPFVRSERLAFPNKSSSPSRMRPHASLIHSLEYLPVNRLSRRPLRSRTDSRARLCFPPSTAGPRSSYPLSLMSPRTPGRGCQTPSGKANAARITTSCPAPKMRSCSS